MGHIRLYFYKGLKSGEKNPLSENGKNSIKNFLFRQYGDQKSVLLAEEDVTPWNSPVEKPDLPIHRWELEDRYLYLNDYPDIDMFQIRIQIK